MKVPCLICFFVLVLSACSPQTPPPLPQIQPSTGGHKPPEKPSSSAIRSGQNDDNVGAASVDARVVLLGTGTPIADTATAGPALAVVTGGSAYLVDLGTGAVRRMLAAYENGITELYPEKVHTAFVTHLHSDHTLGYPDFIFTPWITGREQLVHIYGPPGLQPMTNHLLSAWDDDLQIRNAGRSAEHNVKNKLRIHEIQPGYVYKDKNVEVTAIGVAHGDWEYAYGYVFQTAHRRIVVSGDTAPSDAIVKACAGCDVLVHEVYSQQAASKGPAQWQAYHGAYHTSTKQLAALAARAKPKLLVLTHQLRFGQSEEALIKEITDRYDGKVVYGKDLDVY